MSSTWPAIFGLWSWLYLALLPARFACGACHATFRRYTIGRALTLLGFLLLVVLTILATLAEEP